uniref:50S ribosomal protein L35 n=1 Tax=candidate division WWE3 bacterium TaxID=2053526 RepID=A0A832E0Q4_UNCKA
MSKAKVSKTITERFKITGGGKILRRRGGLKHRRSKERTSLRVRGHGYKELSASDRKRFRRILGL